MIIRNDIALSPIPTPSIRVTVKQEGALRGNQIVEIYERFPGPRVARAWVNKPDGVGQVGGLDPNKKYTVVAVDKAELYNAARADLITPVLL